MNQKSPQILKHHLLIAICMVVLSCAPPKSLFYIEGDPSLISKINKIIESSGIDVNMGIKIQSINNNDILYSYNSQKLLMPASNNKLYTCAAALYYLGSNHVFTTSIGRKKNNLILIGGGDPDLSIKNLDSLARIVSEKSKNIDTLFLDDTVMDSLRFGEGWMWDEGPWWHFAPIGALSVNDNCIDFYVKPNRLGEAAEVSYYPQTNYINVINNSNTVDDTLDFKKFKITRNWISDNNNFTITGEIIDSASTDTLYRNIHDPTLFVGTIFKELLENYGVRVKYLSKKTNHIKGYDTIAIHQSNELIHSAKNLMNKSDNLTAELLIKTIGKLDTTMGNWKIGLDSVKSFLANEIQIDTTKMRLADGSGVSRYNLTNADQIILLLNWIYKSKLKQAFLSTLSDGSASKSTLRKRFEKEGEMVKLKTGHLSGTSNLSGYIFNKKRGPVAISIIMNGYNEPHTKYRHVQNQIVKTIAYD